MLELAVGLEGGEGGRVGAGHGFLRGGKYIGRGRGEGGEYKGEGEGGEYIGEEWVGGEGEGWGRWRVVLVSALLA